MDGSKRGEEKKLDLGGAKTAPATAAPKPQVVKKEVPSTHPRQKLTAAKLATMNKAEIAAVATDRGYDLGHSQSRAGLAQSFLIAQDEDKSITG